MDEVNHREPPFLVVGIGASAGGLEALEYLFRPMPRDCGMAFIVATHLARNRESLLAEILGRCTEIPVAEIEDGQRIEREHIYVMPPGRSLLIAESRMRLHELQQPGSHNLIDLFLGSLAAECREHAVGIIMSGAGSDGSLGIKAIKEYGGLTVVQGADSTAPRFSSMPDSARATNLVDVVLPAQHIASMLCDYASSFRVLEGLTHDRDETPPPTIEQSRTAICLVLRNRTGHDFSGYKHKTFLRRVQRRMQVLQLRELPDYVERLRTDAGEVDLLFRDLLIGVTNFFRDAAAFEVLKDQVVPALFKHKQRGDVLRVWVPACATGEEVYSIAMLLREYMDTLEQIPTVQIFATDIDENALNVARAGRYPVALLNDVSAQRRGRFFIEEPGAFVVRPEIRDMCVFSTHNVTRDTPFSRIDLVSCRNMLIYFGTALQSQVLPVFHYALRPGGFLMLGVAESPGQNQDLFAPVDKKQRVYRRRDTAKTLLPLPKFAPGARFESGPAVSRHRADTLRRRIETRVLEVFAPAHVVVDQNGEILHYSARTGQYLEAPSGAPSRNLLTAARKGLRLELRNALADAARTRQRVQWRDLPMQIDGRLQWVHFVIEPMPEQDGESLFLVLFSNADPHPIVDDAAQQKTTDHTENLERELHDTRERLQGTLEEYETGIEELKSSNEELISVNEELQSSNEELETSKEELQSLNEELLAVNSELGRKVEELDNANSDLRNLFDSTQIAVIFLDEQLVIRSFTRAVGDIFNLIPGDRGRPLTDIAHRLKYATLHADLKAVLAHGKPLERHVARLDHDARYLMRVLPYRATESQITGLLLTFVDVTTLKHGEDQQRLLIAELNHRVRNILTVISSLAVQTLGEDAEREPVSSFLKRMRSMSRTYVLLGESEWKDISLQQIIAREIEPLDGERARVHAAGPLVRLSPKAALSLGMVLHELVTNAVKYGALSVEHGRVEVDWTVEADNSGSPRMILHWLECGGPPVTSPRHSGFGSIMIHKQLAYELGGDTVVDFAESGLRAILTIPLEGNDDVPPALE